MDEINQMRERLKDFDELDLADLGLMSFTGLEEMDEAFFPGGNGLYKGLQARQIPTGGVFILGSNFGSSDLLDENNQWKIRDETKGRTWAPLLKLLNEASIDPNHCFFTNAWPLLHLSTDRKGKNLAPSIGEWLRDQVLMDYCREFFRFSSAMMHPSLYVALGAGPAAFLGHYWGNLASWKQYGWKHVDEHPIATVKYFGRETETFCVAVTHPSMSNSNWRHRKPDYRGFTGEAQLLAEAARRAGIA
jgi:hypothetical protein